MHEDTLKKAFLDAFNSLIDNKDEILTGLKTIIQALTDTSELNKKSARLQSEVEVVVGLLHKCVEENAQSALDQIEYQQRYSSLVEHFENAKNELREIDDERLERSARRENIEAFIRTLENSDGLITEFDEELRIATVETVTVQYRPRHHLYL